MDTWLIILLSVVFIVLLPGTLWFLNITRDENSTFGKIIHAVFIWYVVILVVPLVLSFFFDIGKAILIGIDIIGFSLFPYALSRIFNNLYVNEALKRNKCDPDYNSKRLNRYDTFRQICLLLGFVPGLILTPIENCVSRNLYRRYMSDVSTAFNIGADNSKSYSEKREALSEAGIVLDANSNPMNLPDTWYQF